MKTARFFLSHVLLLLVLPTFALAQDPPPKDGPQDDAIPVVEFRIAELKHAEGLIGVSIRGTDQQLFLHPEVVASSADVASAAVTDIASGIGISVQFTKLGADKIREATATNIGKKFVMLVDGVAFFAPVIREAISNTAMISGDFKRDEAKKIASSLAPATMKVQMLLLRSDWSSVASAGDIAKELRAAMADASVPKSLLEGLPATGPDLLFPLEMSSSYTFEHFAALHNWLRVNGLIVKTIDFDVVGKSDPPEAGMGDYGGGAGGYSKYSEAGREPRSTQIATLVRPGNFLDVPDSTAIGTGGGGQPRPFVSHSVEFVWQLTAEFGRRNWAEFRFERNVVVKEQPRGNSPRTLKRLDTVSSDHRSSVASRLVTMMQAFPNDEETTYRAAARRMGFVPIIVITPEANTVETTKEAAVRAPDIVQTLSTSYSRQRDFWRKAPDTSTHDIPLWRDASETQERLTLQLAAELKSMTALSDNETLEEFEARVREKRQELIEAVGEAFEYRQQLHLQEIASLMKQAQEAQATVATRSTKRKQIVERRVVELLKLPDSN